MLVDTGAACSCTDIPIPLTSETMDIVGIGDTRMTATRTKNARLDLGSVVINEPFWYLPNNSEGTVLGMDIMQKHGFVIDCLEKHIEIMTNKTTRRGSSLNTVSVMSMSSSDPVQMLMLKHENLWAKDKNDCGRINMEVCLEGTPHPPQKQYRIKPEAEAAVQLIVADLENRGIVRRCSSTTNSPIYPVPKPNGSWRLTIDYQRLNKVLPKATPTVANPSTVLGELTADAEWFTVLDIANGFWSLPIRHKDQFLTAFTVNNQQYCWERLPQGLHNSPSIFHRAVADVLEPLTGTGEVLQYVDDILVGTCGSSEDHLVLVDNVLQALSNAGFKMNRAKAQIARQEVQYLGYTISKNHKNLTEDRRKCIAELPRPHTLNSLQKVLGTANYLREFIPNFASATSLLYSLSKGKSKPSAILDWNAQHEEAFTLLKQKLCKAPALGLPDHTKTFHMQVDAQSDTLSGVLAQDHGGKLRPTAYYSRKISPVEQGFDACTQHVLAVHWMLTTTEPIVGFQSVVVHTIHTPVQMLLQGRIKGVSSQRLARWLTDIQARDISITNTRILPHLLGDVDGHAHSCKPGPETRSIVSDHTFPGQTQVYIDGSRYWLDGKFNAGCAVWSPHPSTPDAGKRLLLKLSPTTSAQEAELVALLEAVRSHPEPACVYTDSRYAFGVVHDFMVQWQLRKFLTSAGKPIKHFDIITAIWQAIDQRVNTLSVVKVRAHITKNPDAHEQNNNIVDRLAKSAALEGQLWHLNIPSPTQVSAIKATPVDLKEYQKELWTTDGELTPHLQHNALITVVDGLVLRDGKYVVPSALHKPIIKLYHEYAHVSSDKTSEIIRRLYWWPGIAADTDSWCKTCLVCASVNQGRPGRTKLLRPRAPKGPWEALQLDFIGPLPVARGGYRYCLVIIDKFSKWIEAIPTRNNTAHTVARLLANQIIPLYGSPIQIESDQGTHFTGKVMQDLCKMLGIKQRFHVPYHPQSSGMVERANRTIKEQITKQTDSCRSMDPGCQEGDRTNLHRIGAASGTQSLSEVWEMGMEIFQRAIHNYITSDFTQTDSHMAPWSRTRTKLYYTNLL